MQVRRLVLAILILAFLVVAGWWWKLQTELAMQSIASQMRGTVKAFINATTILEGALRPGSDEDTTFKRHSEDYRETSTNSQSTLSGSKSDTQP
jgi:Tfp pilus assembly protein PilO